MLSLYSSVNHKTYYKAQSLVQLRLRIYVVSQQAAIIERLISDYGLTINIVQAVPEQNPFPNQFDLELCGTIEQVQQGLTYLHSVSLTIQGKPNVDGDSWHY